MTSRPSATKSTTLPSAVSTAKSRSASSRESTSTTSSPAPKTCSAASPSLDIDCFLAGEAVTAGSLTLEVELRDGDHSIARPRVQPITPALTTPTPSGEPHNLGAAVLQQLDTNTDAARQTVSLTNLDDIKLWDLDNPHLYTVHVRLLESGSVIDEDTRRIGFREAIFTAQRLLAQRQRSSSCAASTATRHSPSSARPCPRASSAKTRRSCATICTATSSAPRTTRSRATSSTAATRSACSCSKRFPAGSTSATSHGRRSPSTTSAA